MTKIERTLVLLGICSFALIAQFSSPPSRELDLRKNDPARRQTKHKEIKPYQQSDIERTVPLLLHGSHPRLLIFDGESFNVFNIDHASTTYSEDTTFGRGLVTVSLMVRALYQQFPDRFKEGQPVFQMLFLDSDAPSSLCVDSKQGCDTTSNFAPIPIFGSALKKSDLPLKVFPNWFYIQCLFDYKVKNIKTCRWQETDEIRQTLPYEELVPQVVWRGSDFPFLPQNDQFRNLHAPRITSEETSDSAMTQIMLQWNELTPRWRAVALCAQARLQKMETSEPHWIHAKFSGHGIGGIHKNLEDLGVTVTAEDRMSPEDMARYKYQLALGGGGGTSWRGTLTKLGMPGLLFQQESPTIDWLYEEMKPFKHYIPIDWSLNKLRRRYEWAERNPGKAQKIASEASKLHDYLMSAEYMEKLYQELFVNYLGRVVQNYEVSTDSWRDVKAQYKEHGFTLQKVSVCSDVHCRTRDSTGVWNQEQAFFNM